MRPLTSARFAVLSLVLAALAGCSDEEEGGNSGDTGSSAGGDSGSDGGDGGGNGGGTNPCEQSPPAAGCAVGTTDELGNAMVLVFFDEERLEIVDGQAGTGFEDAAISVQGYGNEYTCETNQPGDEFGTVSCAIYSNASYIQATVGEWINLTFDDVDLNRTVTLTLRVDAEGEAFRVAAAWGLFECLAANE